MHNIPDTIKLNKEFNRKYKNIVTIISIATSLGLLISILLLSLPKGFTERQIDYFIVKLLLIMGVIFVGLVSLSFKKLITKFSKYDNLLLGKIYLNSKAKYLCKRGINMEKVNTLDKLN